MIEGMQDGDGQHELSLAGTSIPHDRLHEIPAMSRKAKKVQTRQTELLRVAMLAGVTKEDVMEIMQALVEKAKKGDVGCAREILDRCIGKADESSLVRKVEELEAIVFGDDREKVA